MKNQRKPKSGKDRKNSEDRFPRPQDEMGDGTHGKPCSTHSQAEAQTQTHEFDSGLARAPGSMIGPYKLLEKIGEGGFGVVYSAEQKEPIRRKVALKIIKPGMGTKEVIARFEAERQALTLMDHPHIARVIDAGATETGQPFFVMELVHGIPITNYCDRYKLTVKQRLELFIDVCQAVQHAHQKGIIHRDIKPRNILVELEETTPNAKVIDFGVAKATKLPLTDHTIHTLQSQLIGTPLYMSPEQADKNGLDIDTRSDIYSLGVLLYEILTGTTPIDRERLSKANVAEFIKIICDEESVRPSAKIEGSKDWADSISASRSTEFNKLRQTLRGDLDWIVIKALEKDRTRRYQTAADFSNDIKRFLNDEPVSASPPSSLYRLRKFARRNKVAFAAGSVVCLSLLAATVISVVMANFAIQSEAKARVSLTGEQEKSRMLEIAKEETNQQFEQSLEILNEAMIQVGKSGLSDMPRMQQLRREILEQAAVRYEAMIDDIRWNGEQHYKLMRDYAGLLLSLGRIRRWVGANEESAQACQKADETLVKLEDTFPNHRAEINLDRATLNYGRAMALRNIVGRSNDSELAFRQAIKLAKQAVDASPAQARFELCRAQNQLGYLLAPTDRWKEAEPIFRNAIEIGSEGVDQSPNDLSINHERAKAMHNLANYLSYTNAPEESEKVYRKALSVYRRHLNHKDITSDFKSSFSATAADFAILLDSIDKPAEAEDLRTEALEISRAQATDFPAIPFYQRGLVILLGNVGLAEINRGDFESGRLKYDECEKIVRNLIAQVPETIEYRAILANQLANIGQSYIVEEDFESAEGYMEESVEQWQFLTEKQPNIAQHRIRLAQTLRFQAICQKNIGSFRPAIEICEKALRQLDAVNDDSSSTRYASLKTKVWYLMALIHFGNLGNEKEAIEAGARTVEFAEQANQDTAEAYQYYCLLLVSALDQSLLDPVKAIELSEHFIKQLPNADSHLVVGIARYRNGDLAQALASLKLSRESESEPNIWTGFYLAMTCQRLQKFNEAIVSLEAAQELLDQFDFDSSPEHDNHRLKSLAKEAASLLAKDH